MPTVRQDVNRSHGTVRAQRSYLLCERHNEDYFGRGGWLEAKVADRIKRELIIWEKDALVREVKV